MCVYCGQSGVDTVLQIDHVEPVVEGGDNADDNLVTACIACNLGKGAQGTVPANSAPVWAAVGLSAMYLESRFPGATNADLLRLITRAVWGARDPIGWIGEMVVDVASIAELRVKLGRPDGYGARALRPNPINDNDDDLGVVL